ncbi:hypothetical protein KXX35_009588 [Aspergillus fumigatus]|nr:hypothetical protein KXX35_009588 [Aspergillus fumigatus]
MKAVVEYWSTGVREYASEYWMIVRNAFGYNGLGVPLQRVLVVGACPPPGEDGKKRYQYTFLWIIDPKAYSSLGVGCRYIVELRQAMCHLFRLFKVEIVFHDIDVSDMEQSMLDCHGKFSNIEFIEEFFYSKDSLSKLDRRFHFKRSVEDTHMGVKNSGDAAQQRVVLAQFSPLPSQSQGLTVGDDEDDGDDIAG